MRLTLQYSGVYLIFILVTTKLASLSPVRARSPYVLKESYPMPDNWIRVKRAAPDDITVLNFGLKQSRFDDLEKRLYEVSDPSHSHYGHHLTAAEVNILVRPSDITLNLVKEWFYDNDIQDHQLTYRAAGDWISVVLPISDAEMLLATGFHTYHIETYNVSVTSTLAWSVPWHLHDHIDQLLIGFTSPAQERVELPRKLLRRKALWRPYQLNEKNISQECNPSAVTPPCLRRLYGTLGYAAQTPRGNRMALVNFNDEFNNRSDIKLFLNEYRPDASFLDKNHLFSNENIAGGENRQAPIELNDDKYSGEGNLDAELMLSIGYPTPLVTYSTGQFGIMGHSFLDWLIHVLEKPDTELPQVISISYGFPEAGTTRMLAKRLCETLAQLSARGVTVVFASGDWGTVWADGCWPANGKYAQKFLPVFPSSCPYITAVGATRGVDPEEVAYDFQFGEYASGGGFSQYFSRPRYQDEVVHAYMKENFPEASNIRAEHFGNISYLFNPSGRAYPDLVAQGTNVVFTYNGAEGVVHGSSASAPIFAAMVGLLNDARLAQGKPAMGFLNPWLYKVGRKGFRDVQGALMGCRVQGFERQHNLGGLGDYEIPETESIEDAWGVAFRTSKGWDVASGLGSPYFPDLLMLALSSFSPRLANPWYCVPLAILTTAFLLN